MPDTRYDWFATGADIARPGSTSWTAKAKPAPQVSRVIDEIQNILEGARCSWELGDALPAGPAATLAALKSARAQLDAVIRVVEGEQ